MKFHLKPRATSLRRSGYSIGDIARKLKISQSTASLWCREIELTPEEQLLQRNRTKKKWSHFLEMVDLQKKARDDLREKIVLQGFDSVGKLSKRDMFIAGVALYWAEGFKHKSEKRFGFCNSDPAMVKFEMEFLKKCFGIKKWQLSFRLSLNINFERETDRVTQFWANYLGIKLEQIGKPFFQKTTNKKNFSDKLTYRGVMRFHVKKSSKLLLETRGAMKRLSLEDAKF